MYIIQRRLCEGVQKKIYKKSIQGTKYSFSVYSGGAGFLSPPPHHYGADPDPWFQPHQYPDQQAYYSQATAKSGSNLGWGSVKEDLNLKLSFF